MNQNYRNTPPYYPQPAPAPLDSRAKAFSIVSLVCGIVSNVTCCAGILVGAVGIIFGIIAAAKTSNGQSKSKWIAGIILSAIGIILGIICIICYSEFAYFFRDLGSIDNS